MHFNFVHQPSTDHVVDYVLSELFRDSHSSATEGYAGRIPVNVKEHEDRYEIVAQLPGVKKEDLRISLEKGILTITGKRIPSVDGSKAKLVHSEISTGTFKRSFYVPRDVDGSKLDAELSNGLLTLTMMKVETALPREIAVK